MKKAIIFLIVLVLTLSVVLMGVACKATTTTATVAETTAAASVGLEGKTVAFLVMGTTTPYAPVLHKAVEDGLTAAGIEWTIFDAVNDITKQLSQMDDAIALKPDLIIIQCIDNKAISPGLKKAYDAGIPVLAVNNTIKTEDEKYCVGYAGNDSKIEAALAAEMMNDALGGSGKVAIIEGDPAYELVKWRTDYFISRLKELNSKIEIVATQSSHWSKEEGTKIMENWLTSFPDLKGVYAHDDGSLAGAIIAITEAGIEKGSIITVGMGGSKEGLANITDGRQYGSISQSPTDEGKIAVEIAIKILEKGLKAGQSLDPFNNPMKHEKITASNVDKWLPGEW